MSLMRILDEIHMETHRWESPDGSTILLLPHGGRILGLYAPNSEKNFFWTHPSLHSAETAQSFYLSEGWHNSGGDRTWIAPEFEFFFPDYPQPNPYLQPRQVDPGNFRLEAGTRETSLVARGSLRLYAASQTIHFTLCKTISAACNPLRQLSSNSELGLAYAGYTLRTTLTIDEPWPSSPVSVGIWNLLQLPHGGEMMFATHSRGRVISYMGSISPQDLDIHDHAIRYRMRAPGENKLGVQAPYLTGRGAYLFGDLDCSSLVIRNFSVNPSAAYVDTPFGSDRNSACAVQACSIDSALGSFSELEYHDPAIELSSGRKRCVDESQVWAFHGAQSTVMQAARLLVYAEL